MPDRIAVAFPSGRPLEDSPDLVQCKHCKRPVCRVSAATHIRACLDKKQEKLKRKKEAKEAKDAAARKERGEKLSENGDDADGRELKAKGPKADGTKGDLGDGTSKSRKRKADGELDKAGRAKKKREEAKAKAKGAKAKGPVDVERQCGVMGANGQQCARSLTCKSHSMGAKRAVPGRTKPYDVLLNAYQKQSQAKQQRKCPIDFTCTRLKLINLGAAMDANAPIMDGFEEASGPVDSEEEKEAVMAAIARACPQPLVTQPPTSTRSKYQYIRMKEVLHNALSGQRGASLFLPGSTHVDVDARSALSHGSASDYHYGPQSFASPIQGNSIEPIGALEAISRRASATQRMRTEGTRQSLQGGVAASPRRTSFSGPPLLGQC